MFRYTKVHGIDHVDGPAGARLWARFILIDAAPDKESRRGLDGIRQIRGFTNGGLPVFTYWIHPDAEVSFEPVHGGSKKMIGNDGKVFNLDSGVAIKASWPDASKPDGKQEIVLTAGAADHMNPRIAVEEIEVDHSPHGPEVDEDILKSYMAPNYCVTAYVPRREALEWSKKLSSMTLGLELHRRRVESANDRLRSANKAAEESLERSRHERS